MIDGHWWFGQDKGVDLLTIRSYWIQRYGQQSVHVHFDNGQHAGVNALQYLTFDSEEEAMEFVGAIKDVQCTEQHYKCHAFEACDLLGRVAKALEGISASDEP